MAAVAGIAALVLSLGFIGLGQGVLWLTVGVRLLIGSLAGAWIRKWEDPGFSLDASRRWVRLTGVHPAFVEATLAQPATLTPSR